MHSIEETRPERLEPNHHYVWDYPDLEGHLCVQTDANGEHEWYLYHPCFAMAVFRLLPKADQHRLFAQVHDHGGPHPSAA